MKRRFDHPDQLEMALTASILVFPPARVHATVVSVAAELIRIGCKDERDRHWRRRITAIEALLARAGVPASRVTAEILKFRTAVGDEAKRRIRLGLTDGRGAA